MSGGNRNILKVQEAKERSCEASIRHVDFTFPETHRNDIAMPVDYSFQGHRQIKETDPGLARVSRLGKVPRGDHDKFLSRSLWLNHNRINSIRNIDKMVNSLFEYPERLAFLDLSRNQIRTIDDCLFAFKGLKILYLHVNKISDLREVFKLRQLKCLHNLTLYANPIHANTKLGNYRTVVKYFVPNLSKLDHNALAGTETKMPMAATVVRLLAKLEGRPLPCLPNKIDSIKEWDKTLTNINLKSSVKVGHDPPLKNISCFCCPRNETGSSSRKS